MSYNLGFILDGLILVFLSVTIFYAARLSLFLKSFREGKEGVQLLIRDLSSTVDKAEQSVQIMKAHALETEGELRDVIGESKSLSDELRFMNEAGDSLANRLEKLADRNRELIDLMENAGGIGTQKITQVDLKSPVVPNRSAAPKKKERVVEEYQDDFEINDFELDADDDDERDFHAMVDGAYIEDEVTNKEQHHSKINTAPKSKVRSFAIFDKDHHIDELEIEDGEQADNVLRATKPQAQKQDSSEDAFHSQAEKDLYEALQRRKKKPVNNSTLHPNSNKVSEII